MRDIQVALFSGSEPSTKQPGPRRRQQMPDDRRRARERFQKRRREDPQWWERQKAAARLRRAKLDVVSLEKRRAQARASHKKRWALDAEFVKRSRARGRARNRGLSPETIESMRADQGGRCAVCDRVPALLRDGRDGLFVDHRHDNGVVRGMLCASCNRHAAALDCDPAYLARLAEYVRRGAPESAAVVVVVSGGQLLDMLAEAGVGG